MLIFGCALVGAGRYSASAQPGAALSKSKDKPRDDPCLFLLEGGDYRRRLMRHGILGDGG